MSSMMEMETIPEITIPPIQREEGDTRRRISWTESKLHEITHLRAHIKKLNGMIVGYVSDAGAMRTIIEKQKEVIRDKAAEADTIRGAFETLSKQYEELKKENDRNKQGSQTYSQLNGQLEAEKEQLHNFLDTIDTVQKRIEGQYRDNSVMTRLACWLAKLATEKRS